MRSYSTFYYHEHAYEKLTFDYQRNEKVKSTVIESTDNTQTHLLQAIIPIFV